MYVEVNMHVTLWSDPLTEVVQKQVIGGRVAETIQPSLCHQNYTEAEKKHNVALTNYTIFHEKTYDQLMKYDS